MCVVGLSVSELKDIYANFVRPFLKKIKVHHSVEPRNSAHQESNCCFSHVGQMALKRGTVKMHDYEDEGTRKSVFDALNRAARCPLASLLKAW